MPKRYCIILLALSFAITLHSAARPALAGEPYAPLSAQQMGGLRGGACADCRYAGERVDECYHEKFGDECAYDMCIANYVIESTCDPADGGECRSSLSYDNPYVVQYKRQDVDCYTENYWDWNLWFTHYYGADCATAEGVTRCEKLFYSCDGTLLGSSYRMPGIVCNY